MRVSLVILGLLTLYSLAQLAGYFGLISPSVLDYLLPAIGIPFLIAAIVEIWLVVKAISQYMRARRSQA